MERLVFRIGMSPAESNKKIGAIRTHLYNYAFAKEEAAKGKDSIIIFRVDDTDKGKNAKEKASELFYFFSNVLGFQFDITPDNAYEKLGQSVFQSERQAIYLNYLEKLCDEYLAFKDEKTGLTMFDLERFAKQYANVVEIDDLLFGKIRFMIKKRLAAGQQFFALARSNGNALYHLASVVDDEEFNVTHVVRGQDKFPIADLQEAVRIALGFKPKKYLHTPMLLNSDGSILRGNVAFDDFIKMGIVQQALMSYLISSGYGDPNVVYPSLEDFISKFDYRRVHRNNSKFDIDRLKNINKKVITEMVPKAYLDSLFIYLEKNREERLRKELMSDSDLCQILLELRRSPTESAEIAKSILTPRYEILPQELHDVVKEIICAFSEKRKFFLREKEYLSKERNNSSVHYSGYL
jgi:glutamyl/glutaminyl-tRNA synthetase